MSTADSTCSGLQFVEKAPATVVQGVREQANETKDKLEKLQRRLDQLRKMAAPANSSQS